MGIACAQAEKAGADYIHVDVIDGQFAPNLTVGPGVVKDIRPHTKLPLDVHLMVVEPGELNPNEIHTPGIYVHRIFEGKNYEKRIEQRTVSQ